MLKDYKRLSESFNLYLEAQRLETIVNPQLREAVSYSLKAPGKRIRPTIILRLGELLGVENSKLLALSLAVEAVHCSTLIHDDLPSLDDDELRRGLATNHIKFGEGVALLAGDGLLSWGFNCLLEESSIPAEQRLELVHLLSMAYLQICSGQVEDIKSREMEDLPLEQIKHKNSLKTGELLSFCFLSPAILALESEGTKEQLKVLGKKFGLLFQLTDDILDVVSLEGGKFGKQPNQDHLLGTKTYVSALGLDGAYAEALQIQKEITEESPSQTKEFIVELTRAILDRVDLGSK